MTLTLELPEPLDRELSEEALRAGVSPADHATYLLEIMAALHDAGKATNEFQAAVESVLLSHDIDPVELSNAVDALFQSPGRLNRNKSNGCHTEFNVDPDWPENYFEETYGCLADDPIERPSQGAYPKREAIE